MRPSHLLPCVVLLAGCGTDVSGPAPSLFTCLLAEPSHLDAGDVAQVAGPGNRGICLEGGDEGAEFLYIPFLARAGGGSDDRLAVAVSGIGVVPTAGSTASPTPPGVGLRAEPSLPGAATPVHIPQERVDLRFHAALRAQERGELGRKLRPGSAAPPLAAVRTGSAVPVEGDLLTYSVATSCDEPDYRTGRVEYVSDRAVVVADTQNPAPLSPADYRHFGETFDTLVDPVLTTHFGEPTDIDGNGRSVLFFTRAVNELAAPAAGTFTAGYFWSGDLFPEVDTPRAAGCPAGNRAEMFYLLAPDPAGEAGPPYSEAYIRATAIGVIGHEYQHLLNAARRLWVNEAGEFEEPWLNEGLSHIAEELLFYAASGLGPRQNIGYDELAGAPVGIEAFNRFMAGNFTNYARYLGRPDTASLMGSDGLPTRGASWSFLRYAADRSGGDGIFAELVNTRTAGLANLEAVLGGDPLAWMHDWAVSIYADDAVTLGAAYRQPSWNLRALYANSAFEAFPLQAHDLASGATPSLRLRAGGTAFRTFGVPPGGMAVLHVEVSGGAPPTYLRGSLVRTR